jgi:hypothetical protein
MKLVTGTREFGEHRRIAAATPLPSFGVFAAALRRLRPTTCVTVIVLPMSKSARLGSLAGASAE